MTEEQLREEFEATTLDPAVFKHREHVRLAWHYLQNHPLIDVLRIFPDNLKRYATAIGKPTLYHQTITWAFLMIIAERMDDSERDWASFASANQDLVEDCAGTLRRYYRDETLAQPEARTRFLMPDRLGAE